MKLFTINIRQDGRTTKNTFPETAVDYKSKFDALQVTA